jgi:putative transposase
VEWHLRATHYPGDLTGARFARPAPLRPKAEPGGRPRTVDPPGGLDAIPSVNRTGCPGRPLPKGYGPWGTADDYFRKWRQAGGGRTVNDARRAQVRKTAGGKKAPTAAALDSRPATAGGSGGETGYGAGRGASGRKRHLPVGSLGRPLAVPVTAAAAVAAWGRYEPVVVRRPAGARGWARAPQRRAAERAVARLLRDRRHARDGGRRTDPSAAMIDGSMAHVMPHRREPEANRHPFKYRRAA